MDRTLVIIGGVVTAVIAIIGTLLIGTQAVFYAGFGGGLTIGLRSGDWNDEMILGGVGSVFGTILLFLLYAAGLLLQLLLNFSDVNITLSIAGATYGFAYLVVAVVPSLFVGAIGGYIGRWIGYRAKLTPDMQ